MLLDWFLSRRALIQELERATRELASFERRALDAEETNTMLSIRVLDLEQGRRPGLDDLFVPVRPGEHETAGELNAAVNSISRPMRPLTGDPGDETSVP